ncbi:MAG: DnaJ C-terminal domain-containing protein [bacterium]
MAYKNYYKMLGVDEKADFATIKRAYRKLAKENHPDAHPGDKQAEAKFKEISEAYSVLSDSKKRQQYDQMRRFGFTPRTASGGFHQPGFDFDFSDIFGNPPRNGRRMRYRHGGEFNLDEFFGFGGLSDLFSQIFDRQPGFRQPNDLKRNINDIHATVEIPFETAVLGGKTIFTVPEKNGKQFSLNISPGTEDGKKLRLSGHGRPAAHGFPQGDLIVTIRVAMHGFFKIEGLDINCEIPIEREKAKKGTKVRVKTVYGHTVELSVPPNTTKSKTFRLKGMGIKNKDLQGDQYVRIELT